MIAEHHSALTAHCRFQRITGRLPIAQSCFQDSRGGQNESRSGLCIGHVIDTPLVSYFPLTFVEQTHRHIARCIVAFPPVFVLLYQRQEVYQRLHVLVSIDTAFKESRLDKPIYLTPLPTPSGFQDVSPIVDNGNHSSCDFLHTYFFVSLARLHLAVISQN